MECISLLQGTDQTKKSDIPAGIADNPTSGEVGGPSTDTVTASDMSTSITETELLSTVSASTDCQSYHSCPPKASANVVSKSDSTPSSPHQAHSPQESSTNNGKSTQSRGRSKNKLKRADNKNKQMSAMFRRQTSPYKLLITSVTFGFDLRPVQGLTIQNVPKFTNIELQRSAQKIKKKTYIRHMQKLRYMLSPRDFYHRRSLSNMGERIELFLISFYR